MAVNEAASKLAAGQGALPVRSTFAWSLLVLATLIWGGNAVVGRLAASEWPPYTLTALRWISALLILTPIAWSGLREDLHKLRERPWLVPLYGVFMALFNLLMYSALHYTTAVNVSIEQASMPIVILLLNFLVLKERVMPLQIVGVSLALLGVLLTASAGQPMAVLAQGVNRGDALMLLGCLFYALYSFALRWRPPIRWWSFIWLVSFGAALSSLPFMWWELGNVTFHMPSLTGWAMLAYIVILPTIVAQLSFARGVEIIGSGRAGVAINLVPVFGSLLAVLLIGEAFRGYHAAGLLLVVSGITLAERAARR